MDSARFDRVAKTLAQAGTRRGVVRLLAVLPFAGVLTERLVEDASAAGRRKRRVKRHKHQQGDDKDHRRGKHKGKGKDTTRQPGCIPNCDRKVCGDDGCGGRCGTCDTDQVCADGRCASSCPTGQKVCTGECIPSNQCCISSDCPAATPDCCGGACVDCSGGKVCIGGTCQETCASYGASACETPTTVCDANIVTCGGNPNCWALPTTSGCCACSTGPSSPSHRTCSRDRDCLGAAQCVDFLGEGHCSGDQDLPCRTDADCASLLRCRQGECGGPICTTDADCEEVLGPGTVCMSGAALPCSTGGGNICWTLCTGA